MLRTLRLVTLLAVVFALPHPAPAEWFADLYAGAAFTDADDHTNRAPAFDLDVEVFDIAYKDSAVIGGRAGYWFDSLPFLGSASMRPTSPGRTSAPRPPPSRRASRPDA